MNKAIAEEEEEKVVALTLIQGGKGPPKIGFNWLSGFTDGAIFLARDTKGDPKWVAEEIHLNFQTERCASLDFVTRDKNARRDIIFTKMVVSDEFCKQWECVEVVDDGSGYWANHTGRLVGDENSDGS